MADEHLYAAGEPNSFNRTEFKSPKRELGSFAEDIWNCTEVLYSGSKEHLRIKGLGPLLVHLQLFATMDESNECERFSSYIAQPQTTMYSINTLET